MARYDIKISRKKEIISAGKMHDGWVISKILENDQLFIEQAEYLIKITTRL